MTLLLLIISSIFQRRRPLIVYAAMWTVVLTTTVLVASFAPEMAFVTAISPSSAFSKSCNAHGLVRIPLNDPREAAACFPAHMVRRSKLDCFMPTVFAALVVTCSACVVRSLGLWEAETRAAA